MTYFTDLEVATLDGLYDQLDEWWHFFYILSDAVEERDLLAAEGVRWLCKVRQRPTGECVRYSFVWWSVSGVDHFTRLIGPLFFPHSFNNYLPQEFATICNGYIKVDVTRCRSHEDPGAIHFSTPTRGLNAALYLWTTFNDETRQRLWKLTDSQ